MRRSRTSSRGVTIATVVTGPHVISVGSSNAFTHQGTAPCSCFIACLDVLGFRARLRARGLVRTHNDYVNLRSAVQQGSRVVQLGSLGTLFGQTVAMGQTTFVPAIVLSDAIYAWADDTADAGDALVTACGWIVAESLKYGIPIRGGIARGDAIVDATTLTFLGQPMIDAYVTEQAQEWLGVALHPSAASLASGNDNVVPWTVPVKKPTLLQRIDAAMHRQSAPKQLELTHAVAWHHYLHGDEGARLVTEMCKQAPRQSREKYQNALKFMTARPSTDED